MGGLRLNYYIINVGLNVVAYLIFMASFDGPLIRRTSIFESKGHGGVTISTKWRDEGRFDLVLLF